MQGSAEEALILLDSNGEMFFKPTAVNSLSKRQYGIRNLSRIPLCFEWKMHAVDAEVLSVETVTGVIEPNEKMVSGPTRQSTSQQMEHATENTRRTFHLLKNRIVDSIKLCVFY